MSQNETYTFEAGIGKLILNTFHICFFFKLSYIDVENHEYLALMLRNVGRRFFVHRPQYEISECFTC
jgi:hypothetical protein